MTVSAADLNLVVSDIGELDAAIGQVNAAAGNHTITASGDMTWTGNLPTIDLSGGALLRRDSGDLGGW